MDNLGFLFLTHPDGRFVVCGTERTALLHEARGYARCDWTALEAAWRADDRRRALVLWGPLAPRGRARVYDNPAR